MLLLPPLESLRFFEAAALLALPTATQAQSVTTLVSNIGQGSTATFTSPYPRSQRFTTGPNTPGYLLSVVEIVSADSSGDRFGARVCTTDINGHPTSTCTGLTAPEGCVATLADCGG